MRDRRAGRRKPLFIASREDELIPPSTSAGLAGAARGEVRFVERAPRDDFRESIDDPPKVLVGFSPTGERHCGMRHCPGAVTAGGA